MDFAPHRQFLLEEQQAEQLEEPHLAHLQDRRLQFRHLFQL